MSLPTTHIGSPHTCATTINPDTPTMFEISSPGLGDLDVLPPELREMVWDHSFSNQRHKEAYGHLVKRPPLLMVSKIVRAEAFTPFLRQIPFQMNRGHVGQNAQRQLAGWVTNLPLRYVHQMRHIYIPFKLRLPPFSSNGWREVEVLLSIIFQSKGHPVVTIERDWGNGASPLERYWWTKLVQPSINAANTMARVRHFLSRRHISDITRQDLIRLTQIVG